MGNEDNGRARLSGVGEGGVKRRHGGVTIDYYDDMLWMGIALQRLQAHTGDARQRGDVNTLWTDIKLGWSEAQGGGVDEQLARAPALVAGAQDFPGCQRGTGCGGHGRHGVVWRHHPPGA